MLPLGASQHKYASPVFAILSCRVLGETHNQQCLSSFGTTCASYKTTLTLGKSIIQHLALGNRLIASALRRPAQTESDPEKDEASYPLTVFHRHLTALEPLRGNLLGANVLEVGPGSTLGFGLLVLLAGANSIICLDNVSPCPAERSG